MKRDIRQYLEDIIESTSKLEEYIKNLTAEDFHKNTLIQDAVLRRIENIGEAVKHIPKHLRDRYPDIPWKRIAGMRDILSHEYFGIILENVWNVAKKETLKLKKIILEMQKNL